MDQQVPPPSSPSGNTPSLAVHGEAEPKVVTYEEMLAKDLRWGLNNAGLHFEKNSFVFKALRKVTKRLDELQVSYAVTGAMALFAHGYRRFTTDIELLVTRDGLKKTHDHLVGVGYVRTHALSKQLRDTEFGVRIRFLVAGEYPGDRREKPVAFPDPGAVSIEVDGIKYLNLPLLIEIMLASGMTAPGRMCDLGDVQQTIKALKLPADFAQLLNPYVRPKYMELWEPAQAKDPHDQGPA